MRISDAQRRVMRHAVSDKKLMVAAGATRAGKSFACAWGHALWLCKHGAGRLHLVAGRSATNAWLNVGSQMVDAMRSLGCSVSGEPSSGMMSIGVQGGVARLRLVGAGDSTARARIQGLTLGSLQVDELPLVDEGFWPWAWTRCSYEDSKVWCSLNPEGPRHWAKVGVVDRLDDLGGVLVDMRMEDNPSLADGVIDSLKGGLRGHLYGRLVEGRWEGASGLVYPRWETVETDERLAGQGDGYWAMGFDWGAASVSAGVLAWVRDSDREAEPTRWPGSMVVESVFRWDAREASTLTDSELCSRLEAWVAGLGLEPGAVRVYVDPATPASFKKEMREVVGFVVEDALNDVREGIPETDARLTAGNVALRRGACGELEDELHGYVWDERAQQRGEDKPVKRADHLCDALRYLCYTTAREGEDVASFLEYLTGGRSIDAMAAEIAA